MKFIKYRFEEIIISDRDHKNLFYLKLKIFKRYYFLGYKLPFRKYCFNSIKYYDKIRKVSGDCFYGDKNGWTLFDAYRYIIGLRAGC